MRIASTVLVVALGALLAGCVVAPAPLPYPAVPVPLAETVPLPPVSETALIWQPGHWDWTGSAYVWAAGRYVPRAGHGGLWQPGFWQASGGGYAWVPAHWV